MAIDYTKLYEIVFENRKIGISITDTIQKELGHRQTSNFYKKLSSKQKQNLKNLKGLSNKQKKEFIKLYLHNGKTASFLAKKYKIRTKTALTFINKNSGEYSRSFKNHNRKLTKYQVIKILIERMKYGTLQKELASKYGVSDSRISCICTGRDWNHIFQGVRKKYNLEILSLKKRGKKKDLKDKL